MVKLLKASMLVVIGSILCPMSSLPAMHGVITTLTGVAKSPLIETRFDWRQNTL